MANEEIGCGNYFNSFYEDGDHTHEFQIECGELDWKGDIILCPACKAKLSNQSPQVTNNKEVSVVSASLSDNTSEQNKNKTQAEFSKTEEKTGSASEVSTHNEILNISFDEESLEEFKEKIRKNERASDLKEFENVLAEWYFEHRKKGESVGAYFDELLAKLKDEVKA